MCYLLFLILFVCVCLVSLVSFHFSAASIVEFDGIKCRKLLTILTPTLSRFNGGEGTEVGCREREINICFGISIGSSFGCNCS